VERRVLLAIVLMLFVAIVPSLLFPPKHPARPLPSAGRDTTPVGLPPSLAPHGPAVPLPPSAAETVWVTSAHYRLGFSTLGGMLVAAQLLDFHSFAPGDGGRPVELVPADRPLLGAKLAVGPDTLALAALRFTPSAAAVAVGRDTAILELASGGPGPHVRLTYRFTPDDYRFAVRGEIQGLGPTGAVLVLGLGDGLRSVEADSSDDFRHYAVVTKAARTQSTAFQALKPGEERVLDGPFEWVAVKSKYFLVGALSLEENAPKFAGTITVGGPRSGRAASRAAVAVTLPVAAGGDFAFQIYAGPLEYRRLARLGHDFDDANPYGGVLRPIIQPVSVFVVNVLLWMHEELHLAYGWVLLIFGVLVRLLLWPLNQRAMESSLRMQAVAPLIKSTQDKYKNDPERLQREMMKIYKDHQVNPFGGCLPMVLPMPVLFALFFVFANTIEFRGVPFLWLPDLSRADPYFVLPFIMGLSMFVLSKVGQIGMPPNPQATTMLYFMPVFMTVLFMRFASGLNLYYAVSNLFSIPQQYRIAQRRRRQQGPVRPPPG